MATCRSCGAALIRTFVDLGEMPPANSYLDPASTESEPSYPLHARVCEECLLVQVDHALAPESIFSDYSYFSSYSASWLEHARRYAEEARARWRLGPASLVVEVASNDGYLLRNFVQAGIPVLGIEPAANVAAVAIDAGVPTDVRFFGKATARDLLEKGHAADLLIGNNVLAHVPDLNDFIGGIALLLAPNGVLTVEFPHLLHLIEQVQFDTIYHEHFSYLSLLSVERAFARHGLRVFDVEQLSTHGGSLRIFACHEEATHVNGPGLAEVRGREVAAGLDRIETYDGFPQRVEHCRKTLLAFLEDCRVNGRSVVAYGAAAKGNTLLNYAGVTTGDIDYVVDLSPYKQGRLMPGSRLPIRAPEAVAETRPDFLLVLPWNLLPEIEHQMASARAWGCQLVVAVPELHVVS